MSSGLLCNPGGHIPSGSLCSNVSRQTWCDLSGWRVCPCCPPSFLLPAPLTRVPKKHTTWCGLTAVFTSRRKTPVVAHVISRRVCVRHFGVTSDHHATLICSAISGLTLDFRDLIRLAAWILLLVEECINANVQLWNPTGEKQCPLGSVAILHTLRSPGGFRKSGGWIPWEWDRDRDTPTGTWCVSVCVYTYARACLHPNLNTHTDRRLTVWGDCVNGFGYNLIVC